MNFGYNNTIKEGRMENFVPYEKMSKKRKKELNEQKRLVWRISPVSRAVESKKVYNRRKEKFAERADID